MLPASRGDGGATREQGPGRLRRRQAAAGGAIPGRAQRQRALCGAAAVRRRSLVAPLQVAPTVVAFVVPRHAGRGSRGPPHSALPSPGLASRKWAAGGGGQGGCRVSVGRRCCVPCIQCCRGSGRNRLGWLQGRGLAGLCQNAVARPGNWHWRGAEARMLRRKTRCRDSWSAETSACAHRAAHLRSSSQLVGCR